MTTTESYDLYLQMLRFGKNVDLLGQHSPAVQDLSELVHVVEIHSTTELECIVHRSLWTAVAKKLQQENYMFSVLDYGNDTCTSFYPPDSQKRRLLREMVDKWWFLEEVPIPQNALPEAIRFRENFFTTDFAYLPQKFRKLIVENNGFVPAVEALTADEHVFLDEFINQENNKKDNSVFSSRLQIPIWTEVPELEIYEKKGLNVHEIYNAVLSGDFLYAQICNYHDCLDDSFFSNLCRIFQQTRSENNH